MRLACGLNVLLHRCGAAIAAGAESVLILRYSPGGLLPNRSAIEKCRSSATGTTVALYSSQREKALSSDIAPSCVTARANSGPPRDPSFHAEQPLVYEEQGNDKRKITYKPRVQEARQADGFRARDDAE